MPLRRFRRQISSPLEQGTEGSSITGGWTPDASGQLAVTLHADIRQVGTSNLTSN